MAPKAADGQKGKRVAPISSSAFSFSLGTPASKKPKPSAAATSTSSSRLPPHLTTPRKAVQPPACPPASRDKAEDSRRTPITTAPVPVPNADMSTPARKVASAALNSLPSPFTLRAAGSPAPLSSLASPGTSRPARHRINAVLDDVGSPFRLGSRPPKEERRDLQGISAIPRVEVAEVKENRRLIEEDEGIGVSPRRNKVAIQYKGPGPPPSVRLATLLSSSNTSLVLFYTSLRHTLAPASSTTRPAVAIARHVRSSAPLRFRIIGPVNGSTHHCSMVRCLVLHWAAPDPAAAVGDTVLVVLPALPADCPRLGVDPRVVVNTAASKRFEVGIWPQWSETSIPSEQDATADETTVVFASRYLVVEAGDAV